MSAEAVLSRAALAVQAKAPAPAARTQADVDRELGVFRAAIQSASFELVADLWADIEEVYGVEGKNWLGRNDRYYLLTRLLKRPDAVHPWLYARCREVEAKPDEYLDLWAREHYKMLRCDEPVPTPSGWTTHGALKAGDWVFGPDGMPTRVIATTQVYTDGEAFELEFDDGTTMQAGADHLWDVERRSRRRVKGEKHRRLYRETETVSTRDIAAHDHAPDNRLAIPVNQPLNMPSALLPIPPYTLGAWLGDGSSASGGVTGADPEIFEAVRADGFRVGPDIAPGKPLAETRTVYGLSPMLRGLGLLNNKHIPVMYQRGSVQQRLELLRGLMDTDGHCNTRGTATFTNISRQLVQDVYELATGLGLKPSIYEYANHHGPVWQVAFQAYQEFNPFKLPRKAARAKPGARPHPRRYIVACRPIAPTPMSCIQVERADGLYLAGRQMVTTHNSTIITFAGAIQEILRDPEITIGIFSHTKDVARKFLKQVKQELETNKDLVAVYPDILWSDPKRQAPQWSVDKGLIVRRTSNPKEATLEAHGLVDGMPTGAHFRLRIYDDVVTKESVNTPEQIEKTTAAWSLSDNLGARGEDGMLRAWHVGTRYSFADTYQFIIDRGALKVRIYPATDNGLPEGTPVFLSEAAWADKKLKQTASDLACQMLQNPAAGKQAMFRKEWLQFADVRPSTLNVYIMVDPAHSKKKDSDNTAIAVIGIDATNNKFLLDGRRHKMGLKERWETMRDLRKKWMRMTGVQMVKVGYERYGMQSDLEYFEERMLLEKDHFDITELNWTSDGTRAKEDRVQRLQPDFASHRFFLAMLCVRNVPALDAQGQPIKHPTTGEPVMKREAYETSNQRKVRELGQAHRIFAPITARDHENQAYSLNKGFLNEYLFFPFSAKKDLIDAASRLYDLEPVPPVLIDQTALEPEGYAD